MKYLIIYSHPHRESLNGGFLDTILQALDTRDDRPEVRVLDLYGEGFNPVLNFGPEKRRRDMNKEPETALYREMLTWAEKLVFVYPIWWGRPPAMVLGFIDRLFSTNFAYRDIPGALLPEGLLKGPPGYLQYWLWNAHRVLMKKALFNFVGIKKVKFFEFGRMEGAENYIRREKALEKVARYFGKSA